MNDQAQRTITPIWRIPLPDFLTNNGSPRMASDAFTAKYEADVAKKWPSIMLEAENLLQDDSVPLRTRAGLPGLVLKTTGTSWAGGIIAVWDATTRDLIAWQDGGVPYVLPQFRGRGIGGELCRITFEIGHKDRRSGVFFSAGGLASRKAAHREAVRDALLAGEIVPHEVLIDYPAFAAGDLKSPAGAARPDQVTQREEASHELFPSS
ncbi:hypothetical protein FE249_18565 (plasmid) [Acidiphilium multivorum]|uniref:hypothetical protein n=1 Tax=Acidiphilium TaxID=522 RepID=UPI00157AC159|nr:MULTISPECIES: hypothetical protein [Acidiphilium]UNC16234.1 hypothetical protein FE249_18565 [Acidiphilium multivorum]